MTVIAAIRLNEVPVLIGDMVVTGAKDRPYQRKLYWISPNLVVGWTGYLITARMVVKDLLDNFNNQRVTKSALERFLTSYKTEDLGSLDFKLVGWLVDEEAHCFLWNSGYPEEVFYQDAYFEGSGQDYFRELMQPSPMSGGGGNDDLQFQALLKALTNTSQALFEEMLYPGEWDRSFGFGYDVLIYWGDQFSWVGPITHLGWDYHWNPKKKRGRPIIAPIITKYVNHGPFSLMQKGIINRASVKTTFRNGIYEVQLNNNSFREGSYSRVTPIYDRYAGSTLGQLESTLFADYYSGYILYRFEKHCFFKVAVTNGAGPPRQSIWVEERQCGTVVGLDTNWLNELVEIHNPDLR